MTINSEKSTKNKTDTIHGRGGTDISVSILNSAAQNNFEFQQHTQHQRLMRSAADAGAVVVRIEGTKP
jgi:hypothetical protein